MFKPSLLLLLICFQASSYAQNIFPEKFEGCNTDQFALEADTATATHDHEAFIAVLRNGIGPKTFDRLRGTLELQIIVDLDGSTCLISLANKTNVKTSKLQLKKVVDEKVSFAPTPEKVAAIIVLELTDEGVGYRRMGMNGKKGWHQLR